VFFCETVSGDNYKPFTVSSSRPAPPLKGQLGENSDPSYFFGNGFQNFINFLYRFETSIKDIARPEKRGIEWDTNRKGSWLFESQKTGFSDWGKKRERLFWGGGGMPSKN
jgi:hypothetical protein